MNNVIEFKIDKDVIVYGDFVFTVEEFTLYRNKKRFYIGVDISNDSEEFSYNIDIKNLKLNGKGYKEKFTTETIDNFSSIGFTISYNSSLPHGVKFNDVYSVSFETYITCNNNDSIVLFKEINVILNNKQEYDSLEIKDCSLSEKFIDGKLIEKMERIKEEFNEVKDHKPKATAKLKVLGELISSAYKINPTSANEMWTYIYDLNKGDGEKSIKFYTYSVLNKIRKILNVDELAELLMMNDELYYTLMDNKFYNIYKVLEGLTLVKDTKNLIKCLIIEKEFSKNMDIYLLYIRNLKNTNDELKSIYTEIIKDNELQSIHILSKMLIKIDYDHIFVKKDLIKIIKYTISKKLPNLLIEIMNDYTNQFSENEISEYIKDYCIVNHQPLLPSRYYAEESENLERLNLKKEEYESFIINAIYMEDCLIDFYFSGIRNYTSSSNSFYEKLFIKWIEIGEIKIFKFYYLIHYKFLDNNFHMENSKMSKLLYDLMIACMYENNLIKDEYVEQGSFMLPVYTNLETLDVSIDVNIPMHISCAMNPVSGIYDRIGEQYKHIIKKDLIMDFCKECNTLLNNIDSEDYNIKKLKEIIKY